jgi:hypothetical protein
MGSPVKLAEGLRLRGQSPLSVEWKVIRNGKPLAISTGAGSPASKSAASKANGPELSGKSFDMAVTEPGNYRVEAWLRVGGKKMAWILSNPIYVRE